tara:strand:+ start:568 stop:822 length:255 start_codon:yes stop_codon:yes gene_type:complete
MARGNEVLEMLIPQGGWIIVGNDYEGITFLECEPITKAQFDAGFAQYDAWKAEQDAQMAADKASATAKLEALGLTADDLKALGL